LSDISRLATGFDLSQPVKAGETVAIWGCVRPCRAIRDPERLPPWARSILAIATVARAPCARSSRRRRRRSISEGGCYGPDHGLDEGPCGRCVHRPVGTEQSRAEPRLAVWDRIKTATATFMGTDVRTVLRQASIAVRNFGSSLVGVYGGVLDKIPIGFRSYLALVGGLSRPPPS